MSSRKAEGNIYRIKHTRNNIVDDILDILDGPKPMTKMKPDKLKPNSADQFQLAQDEYEARGKCSTDCIDRVRRHNCAYPLLKDELDKRRSLVKVTLNKDNVSNIPDDRLACACYVCLKLRRKELKMKAKSKRIGSRQNQRRMKRANRYSRRTRCIDKHDKNCPCRPTIDKVDGGKTKRSVSKLLKIKDVAENDSQGKDGASVSKSDIGSDYPPTTNPSAPSYNSSLSLDLEHEPMDG
ncbi:uncharacterized protein [Epargyreus clarus]|uniref:uncharacterized protein n=1 Tax=Epargyreus clarus TaxID=520877 RepID=UPI003C2B28AF